MYSKVSAIFLCVGSGITECVITLYLLHTSFSIGYIQSSIPFVADFVQSGHSTFYILSCSIFETSPPLRLWNVTTWQRVISANSPQFWIVGAASKVPVQVTILWRRCFLNISKSSVTGRRSGLLSSSCRLFLVSDMRCYHSIQIP